MVSRKWLGGVALLLVVLVVAGGIFIAKARQEGRPVAEADLGDGRIFQIEAVSFGTNHPVGVGSPILDKLGAWAPRKLREFLEPKVPKSKITRDEPVLVIWVTALDATFRTNVDCQSVRLELRDSDGTVYGENQANWFGYDKFWREGHVFHVFPRDEETLQLRVATWRGTNSVDFTLPNPGFTKAADWKGEAPPLKARDGEYELVLTGLKKATNKGEYWRAKAVYWEPEFELWRAGEKLEKGWDLEWKAEDAWGNRGQQLGLNKAVLKFAATFYPSGTNLASAVLITNTPAAEVGSGSNQWWNVAGMVTTNQVEILGFFPAGVHTFSEGEYLTNPPTRFGPTRGGAPSGWVSSSRSTPLKVQRYFGHYSDVPVIYVRVADPKSKQRIAMRVRDAATGTNYLAEPEPEGNAERILPFLVKVPAEVKRVEAELLLLPPVTAEFLVRTDAQ